MTITDNRRARYDYFIEDRYEAGLVLEGWEVKSIRAGQVSLNEAYIISRDNTLHLFGATVTPLVNASTHVTPHPQRTRQLLLNRREIEKLMGKVTLDGYTIVPLNLHFSKGNIKIDIGLAKGKKQHDKRNTEKERDTKREVQRAMRGEQ